MSKVIDFYKFIDSIAPFGTQESWDNSGFLVGNGEKEAKKVLLALDVTEPVLSEAAEIGAELIISHHPVIFGALKEFHPKNIAFLAAEKGIAIISAHTCLDIADGGVNDCLAAALGLEKVEKVDDGEGLIRMGELPEELSCSDFVKYVADKIFFSSRGVTADRGILDSNEQECAIKKCMMEKNEVNGYGRTDFKGTGRGVHPLSRH